MKKQTFVAAGLGIAFLLTAALVLADQPVWGLSLGGSAAIIALTRAFLPADKR